MFISAVKLVIFTCGLVGIDPIFGVSLEWPSAVFASILYVNISALEGATSLVRSLFSCSIPSSSHH